MAKKSKKSKSKPGLHPPAPGTSSWPRSLHQASQKDLTRWQVILGIAALVLAVVVPVAIIYLQPPPTVIVQQQEPTPATPQSVDPRANIRVINYADGVARLQIRLVNEGTKPLRETYFHWGIDSGIGTITGYPKTTSVSQINIDGRELTNLVAFLEQPLYTKRSFLVWDVTISGMRQGKYPFRMEFVTPDGTFTYPPKGLNAEGWSITAPGPGGTFK